MVAARSKGFGTQPSGSVPGATTAFLGRERELRDIVGLLADEGTRAVTLLGPGGVGKTRLALAVAAELESVDPGSVAFVPVAHERSRAGMVAEIAKALEVPEQAGVPIEESIAATLRGGLALLIVDNLEQIPDAGVDLAALLRACAGLTLLATSRAPLRMSGERRYRVEPLPLADDNDVPAAVRLFVERAKLVGPFELTGANRDTVRAICHRLDGLPLAIELAAARTRSLSPDALLARLTNRLTLVSGGPVDVPERQRTLQATISWSYELLAESGQRAFRRLATIPAGFTLDLAAAALALTEDGALAAIDALADHSLLTADSGGGQETRFGMLQTIRDFGLEQAAAHDEIEDARAALARFFASLAEEIRVGLEGADEPSWRAWCARERQNVAAAIDWLVARGDSGAAIGLANALWRYWYYGGHYREGIDAFERVLGATDGVSAGQLARANNGLGALYFGLDLDAPAAVAFDRAARLWEEANDLTGLANTTNNRALLAKMQGDLPTAIAGFERAIDLVTALGDARRLAAAQDNLGMTLEAAGDHKRAAELHARALATSRSTGDEQTTASALRHLASALASMGDVDGAIARADEARALWDRLGVPSQLAYALNTLGTLLDAKGDRAGAERRYEQALALWENLQEPRGIALGLHNLAACAIARGELELALDRLRRSFAIRREAGNPTDLAYTFAGFADVAFQSDDPQRATRLYSFSRALFSANAIDPPIDEQRPHLRRALGKARFDAAWKAGASMGIDDAAVETELIAGVRGAAGMPVEADRDEARVSVSAAGRTDHGLTERELDVLRQVAAGKTNAEIGEALFISPFTAKTHVANLLGKLGVESRAAASTWAAQHGLL